MPRKMTIKINDYGVKYKKKYVYTDLYHNLTWDELLEDFIKFLEDMHEYPIRNQVKWESTKERLERIMFKGTLP